MPKLTKAYLQATDSDMEHPLQVEFPIPHDGSIIILLPENSVGKIYVRVVLGDDLVDAQTS